MEKIVFLDKDALRGAPLRKPNFPNEWVDFAYSHTEDEGEVQKRLKDATIAISNRTPITENIVKACSHLKLIAVAATGYDMIDVQACSSRGIVVCNVREWAISIPEHVFSLTLALRRQLLQYRKAIADGEWTNASGPTMVLSPMPQALAGSTMGLVGYGGLAKKVERIAIAFGMNVIIAERRGAANIRSGRNSFESVVQQSDVLVLLCPLNDDTRGLIGHSELLAMKGSAQLINCARGGVVDESALATALMNEEIAGAGIDVLEEEPPKAGNPLIKLMLPNLIITSHVAWASGASLQTMSDQLIGNLEAFVKGKSRNVVH